MKHKGIIGLLACLILVGCGGSVESSSSSSEEKEKSLGDKITELLDLLDIYDSKTVTKRQGMTVTLYSFPTGEDDSLQIYGEDTFTETRYTTDSTGLLVRIGSNQVGDNEAYDYETQIFHDDTTFYMLTKTDEGKTKTTVDYLNDEEINLSLNFSNKIDEDLNYLLSLEGTESIDTILQFTIEDSVLSIMYEIIQYESYEKKSVKSYIMHEYDFTLSEDSMTYAVYKYTQSTQSSGLEQKKEIETTVDLYYDAIRNYDGVIFNPDDFVDANN